MKLRPAELAWPGGDTPGKLRFNSKVADYATEIINKALPGVLEPHLWGRGYFCATVVGAIS